MAAGSFSSSSSTISSGYSSLTDESLSFDLRSFDFEHVSNELNRELVDWETDDILLVTKANSNSIIIFSIFKIADVLRCEYYRNGSPDAEDTRPNSGTSQIRCQKLERHRRKAVLSGLKFYQDFLKNPQKSFTIYTDLLSTNIGKKTEELLRNSTSKIQFLHHHQYDGSPESHNYNLYFQAARQLLDDNIPGFKNCLMQIGKLEFHGIR